MYLNAFQDKVPRHNNARWPQPHLAYNIGSQNVKMWRRVQVVENTTFLLRNVYIPLYALYDNYSMLVYFVLQTYLSGQWSKYRLMCDRQQFSYKRSYRYSLYDNYNEYHGLTLYDGHRGSQFDSRPGQVNAVSGLGIFLV